MRKTLFFLISAIFIVTLFQNCGGTDVGNPVTEKNPVAGIFKTVSFTIEGYNEEIANGEAEQTVEEFLEADKDLTIDEEAVEDFLYYIFKNPRYSEDASGIIYSPDYSTICDQEDLGDQEKQACIRFFKEVTILQVGDALKGKVTFRFGPFAPVVLDYEPGKVKISGHLPDLKGFLDLAIRVVEQREPRVDEVPSEAVGVVSLSLDQVSDIRGEVAVSIDESVILKGVSPEGHDYDLSIQQALSLFKMEFDNEAETGRVAFALNAGHFYHPFQDSQQRWRKGLYSFQGLTGTLNFDNATETLVATGLGTKGAPWQVFANSDPEDIDSELRLFAEIQLADLDLTIRDTESEQPVVEFVRALDLDIKTYLLDVISPNQGTLRLDTQVNTVVSKPGENLYQVDSGQLDAVGTEYFEGEAHILTGQCYMGVEPGFPVQAATCP